MSLGVDAARIQQHGHPLILIRSFAGQVHLGRRLDVEERVELVLDAEPGRAERINRLAAGETKTDRLHLAGKTPSACFRGRPDCSE